MIRSELIEKVAAAEEISVKGAEAALTLVFESVAKVLAQDARVEIRGWGTLHVIVYDEYVGRNPKNGRPITVAPKKLPLFRLGRELKTRVDGKRSKSE